MDTLNILLIGFISIVVVKNLVFTKFLVSVRILVSREE